MTEQARESVDPHGIIPSAGGEDCNPSNNDDHSGVVQQAGHAALDRRIGVRIPAPEFLVAADRACRRIGGSTRNDA
jgi:hypothetical protein